MSSFSNLIRDSRYFALRSPAECDTLNLRTYDVIRQSVLDILGASFPLQDSQSSWLAPTGLSIYDILGQILPFSSHTSFFWETVVYPFASMLDTANYPSQAQTKFLIFVYARILGFMGPPNWTDSVMIDDGGSTEHSWVIDPKQGAVNAKKPNRRVRFALEPLHPINGRPLAGHDVLDYLTSPEGDLGVVANGEGNMKWSRAIADFLHPNVVQDTLPEKGSHFFIGFDFESSGTVTLKPYFYPRARIPAQISAKNGIPIYLQDDNFRPLLNLTDQLHPSMSNGLNQIVQYFETLEKEPRPRLMFLAVDCAPNHKNRLKIYFHTEKGTSFSQVKGLLTLGGRKSSPQTVKSLQDLELLWGKLFPAVPSSSDSQLGDTAHPTLHMTSAGSHPIGGLTFNYELAYGQDEVLSKVYFPVQNYCSNDLAISRSIEEFYDIVAPRDNAEKGWVEREVAKAYKQRPLDLHTGIHTYIAFGLKKSGWELTTYFSPEIWVWLQKKDLLRMNAMPRL